MKPIGLSTRPGGSCSKKEFQDAPSNTAIGDKAWSHVHQTLPRESGRVNPRVFTRIAGTSGAAAGSSDGTGSTVSNQVNPASGDAKRKFGCPRASSWAN